LKLKLALGKNFQKLAGRKPTLFSADGAGAVLQKVQWKGATLEVTLSTVDSYSVLVVQ
jgi:hypothetical protein